MSAKQTIWNFGKNVRIEPEHIYQPGSVDELLVILGRHRNEKIRAVGSLHAWSDAAKTTEVVVRTDHLNSIEIDTASQLVKVGGGCKVKRLLQELAKHGFTLPSVGLIDEQTVAGAVSTATHGSGKRSLSHYIQAVEIAHFDNDTGEAKLSRIDSGIELEAARCSIGLLGIMVSITFRCVPKYNIEEHAAAHANLESVLAMESSHPQQQFYLMPWSWTFFGHHRVECKKVRSSLATIYRWYCFLVVDVGLHVAMFMLAKILKQAWAIRLFFKRVLPLTIIRYWKVVDDSHAMLTMEHELFRHIEIELFVQRAKLKYATSFVTDVLAWCGGTVLQNQGDTLDQINQIGCQDAFDKLKGCYVHHYPICYRRVQCDDALLAMSTASDESTEDWYAISFISYQWPNDRDGFFQFANFIAPAMAELFGGRCHWGKYNPLSQSTNDQLYPRIEEFRGVVKRFDERGAFRNRWLDRVL